MVLAWVKIDISRQEALQAGDGDLDAIDAGGQVMEGSNAQV